MWLHNAFNQEDVIYQYQAFKWSFNYKGKFYSYFLNERLKYTSRVKRQSKEYEGFAGIVIITYCVLYDTLF